MLTILQEKQFENFYQLIEESFPIDEYRPYQTQRGLLSHPHYQIYVHEKDHELAAIFATWEGPDFIFLEHFAVKASLRDGGLGSKLLQTFLKQQAKPIVIEIEPSRRCSPCAWIAARPDQTEPPAKAATLLAAYDATSLWA